MFQRFPLSGPFVRNPAAARNYEIKMREALNKHAPENKQTFWANNNVFPQNCVNNQHRKIPLHLFLTTKWRKIPSAKIQYIKWKEGAEQTQSIQSKEKVKYSHMVIYFDTYI